MRSRTARYRAVRRSRSHWLVVRDDFPHRDAAFLTHSHSEIRYLCLRNGPSECGWEAGIRAETDTRSVSVEA